MVYLESIYTKQTRYFAQNLDEAKELSLELGKEIKIWKPEGISGMSGGGLWYKSIDNYIPLGIIIKQGQDYVEGYSIAEILKFYAKDKT